MFILDHAKLRRELKINTDIPIYYIHIDTTIAAVKESGISKQNPLSTKRRYIASEIKDMEMEEVNKWIDFRPFDECVVIIDANVPEKPHPESEHHIVHFLEDGRFRSFVVIGDEYKNNTVRENFDILSINPAKDLERFRANKMYAVFAIVPFGVKKNVVSLGESRTIPIGKKRKSKRQKFLYVSNKRYVKNGVKKTGNGVTWESSYPITKVAGHVRNFWLETGNPESGRDLSRNGWDRYENPVNGWTWVSAFEKGKNGELKEKIRLWR